MLFRTSLIISLILVSLLSCGQQEFAGSSGQLSKTGIKGGGGKSGGGSDTDSDLGKGQKAFQLQDNRGEVDVLWLIDTSGSMKDDTEIVRSNFDRFLTNIAEKSHARLTLVANTTAISLTAQATAAGHRQVNNTVNSTDALVIAQRLLNNGTIALRNGAKLVMVVVTDDNAVTVTDQNFISGLNATIQAIKPTLFAFRGDRDQPPCDITRKGVAYDNLARVTGGDVFDICARDWTPNFNKLAESVAMIAGTSFKIDDPAFDVVTQVTLDGVVLDPGDVRVSGSTVQLVSKVVKPTSKDVVIRYKTKSTSTQGLNP